MNCCDRAITSATVPAPRIFKIQWFREAFSLVTFRNLRVLLSQQDQTACQTFLEQVIVPGALFSSQFFCKRQREQKALLVVDSSSGQEKDSDLVCGLMGLPLRESENPY